METLKIGAGILLLLVILADTFETIVLPRTVTRRLRLTRLYYMTLWALFGLLGRRRPGQGEDSRFANAFGPFSLLLLILVWAVSLIVAFALIQWGMGSHIYSEHLRAGFFTDIYMSGTTFFTLGLGDVTPRDTPARVVAVLEAGVGFGFLAIVIGYLPVIYQCFSRREVGITLLDARAGSPPTAGELLRRHAEAGTMDALAPLLLLMEQWASDCLESHLSYPVLVFYRSQHDRESWLATLAVMLDACSLILVGFEDGSEWQRGLHWQARQTYAMCRHAIVDITLVLHIPLSDWKEERLPSEQRDRLRRQLIAAGLHPHSNPDADTRLDELRQQYEPYLDALRGRLRQSLPPWMGEGVQADNWRTGIGDQDSHL